MFNEVFKHIIKSSTTLLLVSALYSCGNNRDAAESLFHQAQTYYESGQYLHSVAILDSLKAAYPEEIGILKKSLHLRTLNQEGIIKTEIAQTDSLISALEEENRTFTGKFKYVKHPDMVEGFHIHKSIAGEIDKTDRVAVEARIDDNDMFCIVSYLTGHDIKHTSIKLTSTSGASVKSESVPYDEARNYRYKSGGVTYEIVTFANNQCDTLGHFAASHIGEHLKVTFQGAKNYSMQLNSTHAKALAETYLYAKNKQQGKAAIRKRMHLENKLQLAQKQINETKVLTVE